MSRFAALSFATYLVVVGVGVFGPEPSRPLSQAREALRDASQEVRQFAGGSSDARAKSGGRAETLGGLKAEDVGNIAILVPFGIAFPALWPRLRWWTVPAGLILSGFIELVQLLFLPWRSSAVGDFGWNGLGTLVGFGLWLLGSAVGSRLRPTRCPEPSAR